MDRFIPFTRQASRDGFLSFLISIFLVFLSFSSQTILLINTYSYSFPYFSPSLLLLSKHTTNEPTLDLTNKLAFYKHKNGLLLSGKLSSVLPPGAPPEIPDAIGTFTHIRSIDVSQNNLHSITPRIAQLQGNLYELNASHNLLTDVSEVALLTNLHSLGIF